MWKDDKLVILEPNDFQSFLCNILMEFALILLQRNVKCKLELTSVLLMNIYINIKNGINLLQ